MKHQDRLDNKEPLVAQIDIGGVMAARRKSRGLSIESVASATKLSKEILSNIENNLFEKIGTAVYVRGYLGIYAKYLEIDAAQIISAYDVQYPDQKSSLKPQIARVPDTRDKQSIRHSKTVSLLVALLVLFGLCYGYFRIEPMLFSTDDNKEKVVDESLDKPAAVTGAGSTEQLMNTVNSAATVADDALTDVINELPVLTGVDQLTLSTDHAQPEVVLESSINSDADIETKQAGKTGQTLRIHFSDECWIKIKDGSNKVMVAKLYKKGSSLKVSGKLPYTLSTARPGAIRKILLGKKVLDLSQYKTAGIQYTIK
ncbi:MAG: hypothetical protein CSA44_01895 [Gammaproteobacteria bacterium]|nr:MAG: hypothetical protein CSA44_01895 [Gammaproteobacteria bacterium]